MSRIGRMPIPIPTGVKIDMADGAVKVTGSKGTMAFTIPPGIEVTQEGQELIVQRASDERTLRSLHGLTRTLVNNMVVGVSTGFEKRLEILGTGYRAQQAGKAISIAVGYSHPVVFMPPEGITLTVDGPRVIVAGADKQQVGEVAAQIRRVRPPEPYKGKGIRYQGEVVRRKAGKAGGKKR
jgi:large subunit ribosomal protein L6